jgi:hypothetical protein
LNWLNRVTERVREREGCTVIPSCPRAADEADVPAIGGAVRELEAVRP